jgi:sugar phosphate isomerase/epimerase
MLTRRAFALSSLAASAGALVLAKRPAGLKIGTMDTVFRLAGKPEAVGMAKKLGLAAVQVTLGRSTDGKTLPLEDASLQQAWVAASRETGIPLDATYLDQLHIDCLKNGGIAPEWVRRGIEITKKLNAGILMTVFFGKCQVLERKQLDYVVGQFRELLPDAEKARIVIGFENTSSGEDNRYAVDKLASDFFKVWYDVGNSTYNGYNVPAEIRMLGRERICQFHFKDKGFLGEGKVDFPSILAAIGDIGFKGYANLETTSPSGNVEADAKRNLQFLERLMR